MYRQSHCALIRAEQEGEEAHLAAVSCAPCRGQHRAPLHPAPMGTAGWPLNLPANHRSRRRRPQRNGQHEFRPMQLQANEVTTLTRRDTLQESASISIKTNASPRHPPHGPSNGSLIGHASAAARSVTGLATILASKTLISRSSSPMMFYKEWHCLSEERQCKHKRKTVSMFHLLAGHRRLLGQHPVDDFRLRVH